MNDFNAKEAAGKTPSGHAMTLMELFDAGYGDRLVPVTVPGGEISPNSSLIRNPKNMGKAPGALTRDGWIGIDLNNPRFRCRDRATVEQWESWPANVGFVAGDGFVVLDNDQGEILDRIIARVCLEVLGPKIQLLRRFVRSPGHTRSAFLFRVVNFVGDPVAIGNQTLKFECTGAKSELQVLAQRKQLVVAGVHPGTGAAYVLSRRVTSLADIPIASPEKFQRIIEGVIEGMKAAGWAPAGDAIRVGPEPPPGAGARRGDFEEVAWILQRLPNRDAPPGEETDWDRYIDDYDEWIWVLYSIFGALGAAPEVEALAMDWANGRAQPGQNSEAVWASIVRGEARSGMGHLDWLAKRFIGAEYAVRGFPEISDEELAGLGKSPDPIIVEMNARYAFIESLNAVFDRKPGKLENGEEKLPQIVPQPGMEVRLKNKIARVTKRASINWFQFWLAHPARAEFADIGCYPPDAIPPGCLNMFEGFAVRPKQGSWVNLERFLREIICGQEPPAYGYLHKLICWWVQNPCVPPQVATVLLGSQGLGKGVFVVEFLGGIIGMRHLAHFIDPNDLVDPHNEDLAGPLLMFFDEMTYGHDRKISGKLKGLDTNPKIRINPKFVKAYMAPNLAFKHYATNDSSGGVPLDHDDRRKFVLDVATGKKWNPGYFKDLVHELREGELSAFLYDALREDLTGFNRLNVYKTRARTELADANAPLETSFLLDLLEQGALPGEQWVRKPMTDGWIVAKGNVWPQNAVAISKEALFSRYLDWAHRQRGKITHSMGNLFRELKKGLGDKFDKERIRAPGSANNDEREYRYVFASLGDCRAAIDAHSGRPREWASRPSARIYPFPDLDADDGEEKV